MQKSLLPVLMLILLLAACHSTQTLTEKLLTPEKDYGELETGDKGAVLLAEVVTKPWGQKVGYVRDLNGFIVEICTPMHSQN